MPKTGTISYGGGIERNSFCNKCSYSLPIETSNPGIRGSYGHQRVFRGEIFTGRLLLSKDSDQLLIGRILQQEKKVIR
jgi:hypothetical protein